MKKETAPKKKTAKQELAEGAAKLKKEIAAEKAAKAAKASSKPKAPKANKNALAAKVDEVLPPPVVESKDDVSEIAARWLKESRDGRAFTLSPKTPIEEYLPLLKRAIGQNEQSQWAIGDLINQGEALYGKPYAVLMALSGIALTTLQAYSLTCRQTPPDLRLLNYSQSKELNKVSDLAKKREIIHDAAEQAKKGHPLTVKEIRTQADNVKPRKKHVKKPKADKHTARPDLALTQAEKDDYDVLEDLAAKLDRVIEGCSFVLNMSPKQTTTLREKLDRIARFHVQIS